VVLEAIVKSIMKVYQAVGGGAEMPTVGISGSVSDGASGPTVEEAIYPLVRTGKEASMCVLVFSASLPVVNVCT